MDDGSSPGQDGRQSPRHRVLIIGSGFGGLFAAKALRREPVDVTIVARTGHHLFQPLLYQVATGILSEGEIAPATREILRRQRNARVLLGEVTDIDLATRTATVTAPGTTGTTYTVGYDSLIVAAGATQSYFGHDEYAEHAPGMKSIDDALELRGRIFGAFELAELESDPAVVDRWLTFVVVGAGPTGVEMAGQIAELAHRALPGDFRRIDTRNARVLLLDGAPAVLPSFGDHLSTRALRQLHRLGIEVELQTTVVGVDETGIEVVDSAGNRRRIEAMTKIWAAGVAGSPLGPLLARAAGAETDRAGRVMVEPDCSLPGHPEVFVVGDLMSLNRLPGVAQVAIQSGQHAAGQIVRRLNGKPTGQPFQYHDKGSMATISRFSAVASVGKVRLSGFVGWLLWLAVHLLYLVGFKNRVTAVLHWFVSFIGRGRSQRTATIQQVLARTVLRRAAEDPATRVEVS
ncbi:NAD(P)/FAD-dependent oxidoreductase [Planosporangium mesophilum]|uniref:NADH:ubiquinone reductase (non-electrogenic) n=1 Tax=Planosporangium mesophilum TaxID=689768 RepID=A0A8J3THR1_9ACTN|nr:NAD(P)/FAD-dependent oxidoreductase [Planosporangium mesophilum]NJC86214.1 NAD(P)/FAD-dependent oxidoreductase [Planosporangium mesophilum]GII25736.1 putative NADH dehydrogenase (NDH) [Planosporangium mesophilum]